MRLNERVRARHDAAREHADRKLATRLGGADIPRAWFQGTLPPLGSHGRGAVTATQGDPPPRPSRQSEVRA
jgi:hypothetical protein